MNIVTIAITLSTICAVFATNSTSNIQEDLPLNKTKRTVAGQVHNYGASRPPPLIYLDNSASSTGITGFYSPVTIKPVFDPEIPKQVAAQQVLYEFQQTPTNAVSNVHVNQYYQPIPQVNKQEASSSQYTYSNQNPNSEVATNTPSQYIHGSETVASPVQHSSLIRHGQNFAQVQIQPQHIQNQHYIPGKYLYVNGKIIYQPQNPQNQNQQHNIHPTQQFNYQNNIPQQRPLNYLYPNQPHQPYLSQKLVPPLAHGYRTFHPPARHQIQQITKPMNTPEVNEEVNEDESEDNAPVKESDDAENEDDKSSYEEAEEDDEGHFGKYSFDEDDDDHESYKEEAEEEEDDDSERGSSRHVPKKQKKSKKSKPRKYSKSNNYKYSENYSTSSKFEKPEKAGKKTGKSPKAHYKSIKYSKLNGKPKIEKIEGKQSENIPVIHKQKIFREKWYVTKSTDEAIP